MQTSYNRDFGIAFAGMKADIRFDTVESFLAEGAVPFGYGIVAGSDLEKQVRVPSLNKSVLSIDADLVASNSTIATVNGNSAPAEVFDTDHDTSMANLATAIALLDGVASAVVSASRDITIIGENGTAIDASAVTTLGASQGTWTQVQTSNDALRGLAVHQHVEQSSAGVQDAEYRDEDTVSVLRQGQLWMPYVTAITPAIDEDAYINVQITAQAGKLTNVSSGNVAIGGKIRQVDTTLKLARVDINLP